MKYIELSRGRVRVAFVTTVVLISALSVRAGATDSGAPDYSGDIWHRSTLTGDWDGARTDLADKGVKFDANLTNVVQGTVNGGKRHEWEYGGRGDLTTNVDTGKLGLWPGGFFTLELEGNWKDAITARETGAIMPSNSNQLYPEPKGDNFNVPQLSFAQFLSPYAGLVIGKLDTVAGGDNNAFAHGKGDKQFMNLAFNVNPVLLLSVPYSTLAVGGIVLPNKDPEASIVQFAVLQSNGKASTPGFDDLSTEKLTFWAEGRVRTHFFDKTGHQLLGGSYSNRNFTSLDQRLGDILPLGDTLEKESDTWAVYYNFDQYVYETDDERGMGVFGRLGFADGNPNLMQTFFSFGLGGKGPCAARPHDGYGIGYYFIDIQSPTLQGPLVTRSFLRDEYGFEAYYSLAITPWMLLTFDMQVLRPSQNKEIFAGGDDVGTATILGVRQEFVF